MSRKPRRILLKFGSGILTQPRANALDAKQFARLTAEVAQLVRGGCKCVIVSSGAVAARDARSRTERASTRLDDGTGMRCGGSIKDDASLCLDVRKTSA
jgi:glutamate 5-kinase